MGGGEVGAVFWTGIARRQCNHDGGEGVLWAATGSRSELGRQIAIDLETDADLDQRWCSPGHRVPPRLLLVRDRYVAAPSTSIPLDRRKLTQDGRSPGALKGRGYFRLILTTVRGLIGLWGLSLGLGRFSACYCPGSRQFLTVRDKPLRKLQENS